MFKKIDRQELTNTKKKGELFPESWKQEKALTVAELTLESYLLSMLVNWSIAKKRQVFLQIKKQDAKFFELYDLESFFQLEISRGE